MSYPLGVFFQLAFMCMPNTLERHPELCSAPSLAQYGKGVTLCKPKIYLKEQNTEAFYRRPAISTITALSLLDDSIGLCTLDRFLPPDTQPELTSVEVAISS